MNTSPITVPTTTGLFIVFFIIMLATAPVTIRSAEHTDTTAALNTVISGNHRTEEEKDRDQYRHPLETLQFLGIQPDMTVVEIYPGGGWYTRILAPFLKDSGTFYAAGPNPGSDSAQRFEENFVQRPEIYGTIHMTTLDPTDQLKIAPDGSADMVLTFRNVHNWMSGGSAEQTFQSFYQALKPGGILGVVEHRGSEDEPQDPEAGSGYVRQDYVIKLAADAGFELIGQSEINANPK
ncbi:MAG: methyltransferase, partial [Gammaproteobacteria bacterium]